jgi:hypothetical protein
MNSLSPDILVSFYFAGAIVALFAAESVMRARCVQRHWQDREEQRRKHWGYT